MSAIIPFIEGCFIISHDATIHPMRSEAGGIWGWFWGVCGWELTRDLGGWVLVAARPRTIRGLGQAMTKNTTNRDSMLREAGRS